MCGTPGNVSDPRCLWHGAAQLPPLFCDYTKAEAAHKCTSYDLIAEVILEIEENDKTQNAESLGYGLLSRFSYGPMYVPYRKP